MLPSTIFELWLLASPLLALLVTALALHLGAGQLCRRIAVQKAAAEARIRGVEERMEIVEGELRSLRSMGRTLLVRQQKPNSGSKNRSESAGLSGDSREKPPTGAFHEHRPNPVVPRRTRSAGQTQSDEAVPRRRSSDY